MVFILTLIEVARSIFCFCLLDCYWLSTGPPSIKLMVGLGSDECLTATTALLEVGVVSAVQVGSRINLLRCPAQINLSIMNFKLWH